MLMFSIPSDLLPLPSLCSDFLFFSLFLPLPSQLLLPSMSFSVLHFCHAAGLWQVPTAAAEAQQNYEAQCQDHSYFKYDPTEIEIKIQSNEVII